MFIIGFWSWNVSSSIKEEQVEPLSRAVHPGLLIMMPHIGNENISIAFGVNR